VYLWLLTRVLFVAHAAAGASDTRHSLRPLLPTRAGYLKTSGEIAPREYGFMPHAVVVRRGPPLDRQLLAVTQYRNTTP
jgi:hypothetical protein